MQESANMLRRDSVQELFNGYYYDERVATVATSQCVQRTNKSFSRQSRNTPGMATPSTLHR